MTTSTRLKTIDMGRGNFKIVDDSGGEYVGKIDNADVIHHRELFFNPKLPHP
jgi:hypothetical protein